MSRRPLICAETDLLLSWVGDRTLRTLRCRACGAVTHWEPLDSKNVGKMGVNVRNFEPSVIQSIRVRHLDGADTWKFLD